MITYTKKQITRLLKIEFIKFCIVGGLGFSINFAVLTIFHGVIGWPLVPVQLFGSEVALLSNFMLHNRWTYGSHKVQKTLPDLLVQFHAISWPAIIGSTLMVSFGVIVLKLTDLVALVISSIIALFWNFLWSKYVVWKDTTNNDVTKLAERR